MEIGGALVDDEFEQIVHFIAHEAVSFSDGALEQKTAQPIDRADISTMRIRRAYDLLGN